MKRNIYFITIIALFFTVFFNSCKKDPNDLPIIEKDSVDLPIDGNSHKYVNDWIYENMSIYYFWNNRIPKSPDYTLTPDAFFSSILSKYNATSNPDGDRFSWIQDNYIDLLNSLGGVTSDDIGFEYVRVRVSEDQYYLLVLYPKPGSDAEAKGIRKGRFVIGIDGQNIYDSNLATLVGGTGTKTLEMADWVFDAEKNKYQLTKSGNVTVQMHKDFAEIPVYLDSVYTTPNGKKAGYLVYNFFAADKGDKSNDYDKLLMNTLEKIKNNGATEFILDLRYNGGGALSSTIALASALVPNRSTSAVFGYTEYNALVQAEYERIYGKNALKNYFTNVVSGTTIPIPSLGFPKIYVIVSRWTASASELIINGLKPYMEVVLIGEQTVGKNVGSTSFYEENDPKNKWGMQPIIAKFFNSKGESDYTAGFVPDYEVIELDDDLRLVDFGNTDDKLLNKALSLINGAPLQPTPARATKVSSGLRLQKVPHSASMLEKPAKQVLNDDIRGEDIRKLMVK